MMGNDRSITSALEQLALALGESEAVPLPEVIRALERAAERLRGGTATVPELPTDLVTQSEAARRVGVSRQAIHQWVQKGVVPTYRGHGPSARQSPMVSLAEVVVVANRATERPFSSALRDQLIRFLSSVEHLIGPDLTHALMCALDEPEIDARTRNAIPVLREFVIAAMGTTSRQQEFSDVGVVMLADLEPAISVDPTSPFGQLCSSLDLLFRSAGGTGFDSAALAVLAIVGCGTIGAALPGEAGTIGRQLASCAETVWGEAWLNRLLDVAFYVEEQSSPPLTRCTAAMSYLCTNRVLRRAQSSGISMSYARTAGLILPDRHFGLPLLNDLLRSRGADADSWRFSADSANWIEPSLERSGVSPFRPFVFAYGLLADSIHGVRRYCFSTQDTRAALVDTLASLGSEDRARYIDLTIETLTRTLSQPSLELTAIDKPQDFDWWKDHIVRATPREIVLGLRDPRARRVAHALVVQRTALPEVVEAAESDRSLRDQLRIYVKNLEFGIVGERYHDDQRRGTTRTVKSAAETLTTDEARRLAEAEVEALVK